MIQSHNNPITNFFARGGGNILLLLVVLAAAALLFLGGKAQAQTETPIVAAALLSSLSGDTFAFGLALSAAGAAVPVATERADIGSGHSLEIYEAKDKEGYTMRACLQLSSKLQPCHFWFGGTICTGINDYTVPWKLGGGTERDACGMVAKYLAKRTEGHTRVTGAEIHRIATARIAEVSAKYGKRETLAAKVVITDMRDGLVRAELFLAQDANEEERFPSVKKIATASAPTTESAICSAFHHASSFMRAKGTSFIRKMGITEGSVGDEIYGPPAKRRKGDE